MPDKMNAGNNFLHPFKSKALVDSEENLPIAPDL